MAAEYEEVEVYIGEPTSPTVGELYEFVGQVLIPAGKVPSTLTLWVKGKATIYYSQD